jgi:hypothetical protein
VDLHRLCRCDSDTGNARLAARGGLERDEGDKGEPGADLAELTTACRTLDDAARSVNSFIWFAMDRIAYHGRLVTVVWDKTGEHYGQEPGLRVLVDGQEVARADSLRRILCRLP